MSSSLPQAVFFDWDGTLVDTLPWLLSAHNHVRTYLELAPWSVEEFKHFIRYSSRELYGPLYGDRAEEALAVLRSFMEENHLANLRVLPDALALLEFLADEGIPAGIVSNKRHEFLLREINHLGWDHLSRISIGAGYAAKDKPAADPLLLALKQCGLEPGAHIWYVGDSETDMLTAGAAGCSAILVRHNHDNEALIDKFQPLWVFDDCVSIKQNLMQNTQVKRLAAEI